MPRCLQVVARILPGSMTQQERAPTGGSAQLASAPSAEEAGPLIEISARGRLRSCGLRTSHGTVRSMHRTMPRRWPTGRAERWAPDGKRCLEVRPGCCCHDRPASAARRATPAQRRPRAVQGQLRTSQSRDRAEAGLDRAEESRAGAQGERRYRAEW